VPSLTTALRAAHRGSPYGLGPRGCPGWLTRSGVGGWAGSCGRVPGDADRACWTRPGIRAGPGWRRFSPGDGGALRGLACPARCGRALFSSLRGGAGPLRGRPRLGLRGAGSPAARPRHWLARRAARRASSPRPGPRRPLFPPVRAIGGRPAACSPQVWAGECVHTRDERHGRVARALQAKRPSRPGWLSDRRLGTDRCLRDNPASG